MPLTPGARLGPYEVLAMIGSGGMGEVYRARDSRLSRDVAIKVLAAHLSASPDVRARFEREARAVAALNHAHICVLHDIGREGEIDYIVMELVEGETLADRLTKGPLPAEPLLKLAIEIAGALDKAHRAGIVHRDLKPGNIMLTKSGAKLMDFGLARATAHAADASDMTQSPSMTRPLTARGTIIGTLQYMAPEQLEGKEADARADLWALGCVLYEMATGRRAFHGETAASIISAVMRDEPRAMSELAPMTPPLLERIVKRCLAKDPDDRWQTARDLMHELGWIAQSGSSAGGGADVSSASGASASGAIAAPAPTVVTPASKRRALHPAWIAAGVASLTAIAALVLLLSRPERVANSVRFSIPQSSGIASMNWPAISPDGKSLAFLAADSSGTLQVWVRPLKTLVANPLPGTENAKRPFWSPDSRFIAYFTDQQLKKVPAAGGPPQLICDVRGGADGSWGAQDVILFDGSQGDSIRQVSASGGVVSGATSLDREHDLNQAWPFFLPDGEHFLFVRYAKVESETELCVGRLGSFEVKKLGQADDRGVYVEPGYIFYASDNTLMARPFDVKRLEFTGEPFPVAEEIEGRAYNTAHFSASSTGVLAFMVSGTSQGSALVWIDRTGKELEELCPKGIYRDFEISPDGTRVAYGALDPVTLNQDLWIWDIRRKVATKVTFDPEAEELWPVWAPDGQTIAYASDAGGAFALTRLPASGGGRPDSIYRGSGPSGSDDWSSNGEWLAYSSFNSGAPDVCVFPVTKPAEPTRYVATDFGEHSPHFSPDGRWIAYVSDESGRDEVYVQSFPEHRGKWQISSDGGTQVSWRRDGKEIFYLRANSELMAVPVSGGETFEAGVPKSLFTRRLTRGGILRNRYDAAADGQRFLLNVPLGDDAPQSFTVVLDWQTEIERK